MCVNFCKLPFVVVQSICVFLNSRNGVQLCVEVSNSTMRSESSRLVGAFKKKKKIIYFLMLLYIQGLSVGVALATVLVGVRA